MEESAYPEPITGQCLCGAVRVELTEAGTALDVCHCTMCRQWGGLFIGLSAKGYQIDGEEMVVSYRSSQWAARAFCGRCGSKLWFDFLPGDHRSFLAGLFALPAVFAIHKQIFIDEKPGWYDLLPHGEMRTGEEVIAEAMAAGYDFD